MEHAWPSPVRERAARCGLQARRLLRQLRFLARGKGFTWATDRWLARELGVAWSPGRGSRTVERALAELEAVELVARYRGPRRRRRGGSLRLVVVLEPRGGLLVAPASLLDPELALGRLAVETGTLLPLGASPPLPGLLDARRAACRAITSARERSARASEKNPRETSCPPRRATPAAPSWELRRPQGAAPPRDTSSPGGWETRSPIREGSPPRWALAAVSALDRAVGEPLRRGRPLEAQALAALEPPDRRRVVDLAAWLAGRRDGLRLRSPRAVVHAALRDRLDEIRVNPELVLTDLQLALLRREETASKPTGPLRKARIGLVARKTPRPAKPAPPDLPEGVVTPNQARERLSEMLARLRERDDASPPEERLLRPPPRRRRASLLVPNRRPTPGVDEFADRRAAMLAQLREHEAEQRGAPCGIPGPG